ncbi:MULTISPECIES: glycosyltransferase family 2 protein [Nostocales]|uniref:Glycosyltransferase family 2 protein n=3 Tax=Nostocales TaxID=1161 RepID=A0A8S9TGG0_9CYAN|nr:glycosyltransferase family 2 protein [Tolypothrix bouteillei]KAF3890652.1 glycosyltransferase family 2 protein [Tolypothrix bouteillei VB521301]
MTASVSTIIPCYRCSKTIYRAVDSVAKQTLLPAEVILVDDGSGDETLQVLWQLQRDYGKDWIKIIALKENSGAAVARNTGWNAASHKYIAFLDADDAWHPDKIAIQFSWMLDNPEIVLSGHRAVVHNTKAQLNYEPIPSSIKINRIGRQKILFSNRFSTSCVMIKRAIPQRFNPAFIYSQDYLLWLDIILAGGRACILSFPVSYYFKAFYGAGGQTKYLSNGKAGEQKIYQTLLTSRRITYLEWQIISLWALAKYYRRVLICSAQNLHDSLSRSLINEVCDS